ncbi:hypothetical protein CCHR01_13015 [Colletotrichum chrysophilum]|uniref:Uncharacterized protein n=1 Tax=Colletotrichum chrysophilum TaxID=1836956 RepID=A0AAD9AAQ8_9PEZI|nr:hypothetical protein CCHR01_13015 [Colletotrichum chrysophilum]
MRVGPRTMEVCPDFSAAHDSAPVSEWLDQRLPPGRVPPQRRAETVVQNSIDSSMAFFSFCCHSAPAPSARQSPVCLVCLACRNSPLGLCAIASQHPILPSEYRRSDWQKQQIQRKINMDEIAPLQPIIIPHASLPFRYLLTLASQHLQRLLTPWLSLAPRPLFPPQAPAYPRSSWLPQSCRRCRGVCHSFQAFWWLCRGCRSWQPSTARTALAKQMPWRFPYKRPAQLIFLRG